MGRFAILALATIGALALWSEDTCPTCKGAKRVKCYQYGGKPASQEPCAACFGAGGQPCTVCSGSGSRPCASCDSKGLVESYKCRYCEGAGSHTCKLCRRGRIACPVCNGSGDRPIGCEACAGAGHVPCVGCSALAVPCAGCRGSTFEKCLVCGGKGETTAPCGKCGGGKVLACAACEAYGSHPCGQCKALGTELHRRQDGTLLQQGSACRACQKMGKFKCATCNGKGTAQCGDCAGKGTTRADCWLCDGQKTMPCRQCSSTRSWSGESATTGVRCVVFDCSIFQPRLAQGLKNVLHLGDYSVWRVILDARGGTRRVALGGDGWELVLVGSGDAETPVKDAYEGLSPDQVKLLERWVESQGDVAEALRRPFGVGGGDVRTCLALTSGSTLKDARLFRLRPTRDSSVSPIDLAPDDALWQTWVSERLLAAPE